MIALILASPLAAVAEVGRVQVSRAGNQKLASWSSQTDDFWNCYLSLPRLALGITMIGRGLVSSMSGQFD